MDAWRAEASAPSCFTAGTDGAKLCEAATNLLRDNRTEQLTGPRLLPSVDTQNRLDEVAGLDRDELTGVPSLKG